MRFNILGDYFNGKFHGESNKSGQEITKHCPGNINDLLWKYNPDHHRSEEIISSAKKGYKKLKQISIEDRIKILSNLENVFKENKNIMAEAISYETGKPLWEAQTEVTATINKVNITLEQASKRIVQKNYQNIAKDTDGNIHFKPIGPTLVIGPFNFPCHLPNGQMLSALLCGNSIIFKPSEKTLYSSQLLFEAYTKIGLPENSINLAVGSSEIAKNIIKSKEVRGIHFTGSKEVGIKILEQTHKDLSKLVALELGGKNISIVHDDCALKFTIQELIKSAFLSTGQRCTASSIVLVHENILDTLLQEFHTLSKKIIIDHPIDFEKEPFMGPLIDQHSKDNYLKYIGMSKREGAQEIMRGKELEKKYPGFYVSPSIYLYPTYNPKSIYLNTEVFGPSVAFIPFKDQEEAIQIAEHSSYGLACSVYTKDRKLFDYYYKNIETGLLNFNRSTVGASSLLPFGGVKNSGNYRPAGIAVVDSCVYQQASLINNNLEPTDGIKGIV